MAKYEILGAVEFGKLLVKSEDMDPVYVAMWKSKLSRKDLCKFILGWMCYYHAGVAAWLVTQKDFFKAVLDVAVVDKGFGRGSQRIHHRGPPAVTSAEALREQFTTAEEMLDWCSYNATEKVVTAHKCFDRVMGLVGFGPCFAWRIPDIQECLNLLKIKWVDRDVDLMFKNPRKGAEICCDMNKLGDTDKAMRGHLFVKRGMRKIMAPPRYDRHINIQETETVFCKWKSHIIGRYALGRDTERSRKQLQAYAGDNAVAKELLRNLPKEWK